VTQKAANPVTEALWLKVLEDFESDKAHQAFLTHCRDADVLPEAARRYSQRKNTLNESQSEEREAIDKRMAAIALLAMSQLEERRTPPNSRAKRILTYVAALMAVGTVIVGMALLAM
jgi:Lon protease-like protein